LTGTGFFVDGDGSLLTCFHVVRDKSNPKVTAKDLEVTFQGQTYPADCIFPSPDPSKRDVAVLQLKSRTLPPNAIVLPLDAWERKSGPDKEFRSFGFRSPDKLEGLHAKTEIRGRTDVATGLPLLQLASEAKGAEEIRSGMSGAPLYCDESDQIVGMIAVRVVEEDEETIPFAIPMEAVAEIWYPMQRRLWEESLLHTLLEILHGGDWFTQRTLRLFYESLPIASLAGYDTLGENKIKGLLDQLRGQERIYDFLNWLRIRRPDIPVTTLIDLPPVNRINFVNRNSERKRASATHATAYTLLDAPAGYGKTELLRAIEQDYFGLNWLCVCIDVPDDDRSAMGIIGELAKHTALPPDFFARSDSISEAGIKLSTALYSRLSSLDAPGLVVLIDNAERLPEDQIGPFLNDCLGAISRNLELRVCCAGRYIKSSWIRQASKAGPRFSRIPLTPFRFRYVEDTVRSLFPGQNELALRAAHLMYMTGGHPGCMAEILERMDFVQPVEEHFREHQDEYREIVLKAIAEIGRPIPAHLQNVFDDLSVFRCYDYRLLQQMLASVSLDYDGQANSLERELTATSLVRRKSNFVRDEIVRRLLAIRMYWKKPRRFLELCAAARDIYRQDLDTPTGQEATIALEWLFQELQLRYHQSEQGPKERAALREAFFADDGLLQQALEILRAGARWYDSSQNLLTQLEGEDEDWEFRFFLNYFLRTDRYKQEPFETMLHSVNGFIARS
jgi:hypothetical protein